MSHTFCCPTCGDAPTVTNEIRCLPCGHFVAFRTLSGVVMFWQDTGVMTLHLARAAGEVVVGRVAPLNELTPAVAAGQ